jgi:hypothetical protein
MECDDQSIKVSDGWDSFYLPFNGNMRFFGHNKKTKEKIRPVNRLVMFTALVCSLPLYMH